MSRRSWLILCFVATLTLVALQAWVSRPQSWKTFQDAEKTFVVEMPGGGFPMESENRLLVTSGSGKFMIARSNDVLRDIDLINGKISMDVVAEILKSAVLEKYHSHEQTTVDQRPAIICEGRLEKSMVIYSKRYRYKLTSFREGSDYKRQDEDRYFNSFHLQY